MGRLTRKISESQACVCDDTSLAGGVDRAGLKAVRQLPPLVCLSRWREMERGSRALREAAANSSMMVTGGRADGVIGCVVPRIFVGAVGSGSAGKSCCRCALMCPLRYSPNADGEQLLRRDGDLPISACGAMASWRSPRATRSRMMVSDSTRWLLLA